VVFKGSLVVIGASAGGVESLRRLVAELPPDLPAAVAVVLHLSPTSKSMLAAILSRSGPLPAHQSVDGEAITAGTIVVARPDHHLVVEDGRFRVVRGPAENSSRPAIDPLFRSAARVYGNRTIGVVLSGSLDDGTAGLFEVKRRGGWTLVQDARDAPHPDMPLSAIEHVTVDIVADCAALGRHIATLAGHGPRPELPEQASAGGAAQALPSGMSCPDCNGQLWEINDGEPLRFRCRVGHEWTGRALVEGQERSLENALWASLRIVGERSQLTSRMLERARARDQHHVAHLLESRLDELGAEAHLLQTAIDIPVSIMPGDISAELADEPSDQAGGDD
jgi:two-component system chemotaxis response regulator CheB